jgi:hypothetical protein
VKDKKMSFIRYFEGAQPGKKRKIENEKTEKSKEYEVRRKERSFNQQWLVGRPCLSFNPTENTMTCIVCSDHYKKIKDQPLVDDRNRKHNSFIIGSKNFRMSAIEDHSASKPHIIASQVAKSIIIHFMLIF